MILQKHYGQVGMFGAVWFFLNLLIEYGYNLFPPGTGWLFVTNQLMFFVAMVCLLWLLIGLWQNRVTGERWYGRFPLGLFIFGWATLTIASFITVFTGNNEMILYPIGGAGMLFGSLLTGIATAVFGQWRGWHRFAPLYLGLINPVSMIIRGEFEPNLLVESLWMAGWFLVGFALYQRMNHVSLNPMNEGVIS